MLSGRGVRIPDARLGLSEKGIAAAGRFFEKRWFTDLLCRNVSEKHLKELADYVRKLQDLNSLEQFLCERLDLGVKRMKLQSFDLFFKLCLDSPQKSFFSPKTNSRRAFAPHIQDVAGVRVICN